MGLARVQVKKLDRPAPDDSPGEARKGRRREALRRRSCCRAVLRGECVLVVGQRPVGARTDGVPGSRAQPAPSSWRVGRRRGDFGACCIGRTSAEPSLGRLPGLVRSDRDESVRCSPARADIRGGHYRISQAVQPGEVQTPTTRRPDGRITREQLYYRRAVVVLDAVDRGNRVEPRHDHSRELANRKHRAVGVGCGRRRAVLVMSPDWPVVAVVLAVVTAWANQTLVFAFGLRRSYRSV